MQPDSDSPKIYQSLDAGWLVVMIPFDRERVLKDKMWIVCQGSKDSILSNT